MVDIGGRNPNLGVGTTRPIVQLSELESRLLNSGVVKTPAAAREMAKAILKNLQSAGVAKGKTNLKDALLQFQKQNGLPQTGRLDDRRRASFAFAAPGSAATAAGRSGKRRSN